MRPSRRWGARLPVWWRASALSRPLLSLWPRPLGAVGALDCGLCLWVGPAAVQAKDGVLGMKLLPPHLGWVLLCAGWLAAGAFLSLAFKVGYEVGNQGARHWQAEADSLRRVMRDGICVKQPGQRTCLWMIPRDTVRR